MQEKGKNCNTKEITIGVINWNVTPQLRLCIDSILKTCMDIDYEMYVIDNNSSDEDFANIISEYCSHENLIFVKNETNHGALAFNEVFGGITGRYFMIIGPDTVFKTDAVRNLIRFMDDRKDAGAASGKLLNTDGSPQMYYLKLWSIPMVFYRSLVGRTIDRLIFSNKKSNYYNCKNIDVESNIEVEQPAAAALIIRPAIVEVDGYLIDSEFPLYYNDVDLCKRIMDRGHKIFLVPDAEVIHDDMSSFKKVDPLWGRAESIKSQVRYFRKHHRNQVPVIKAILIQDLVMSLVVAAFRRQQKRRYKSWVRDLSSTARTVWEVIKE